MEESYLMDMHKKSKLDFSPVDVANLSFNRMNLFKYLRASLKSYKPNMKLLYGYLNDGLDANKIIQMLSNTITAYDSFETKIDYCFAYSFIVRQRDPQTGEMANQEMVWLEAPMFYTPKSLNTFAYYVNLNREKEFLDDYVNRPTFFGKWIMDDYLKEIMDLDLIHENAPNYWKNPRNAGNVMKAFAEMSNMYTPRQ